MSINVIDDVMIYFLHFFKSLNRKIDKKTNKSKNATTQNQGERHSAPFAGVP